MKLYSAHHCAHSHRAKLFLSLQDIPHDAIEIDIGSPDPTSEAVLRLNPFGQLPILMDGDAVVADSNAILVYLAKKVGPTTWLPESSREAAEVQRWLSVAARGLDASDPRSHALLGIVDRWLSGRRWLASITPTIADVALYGDVARALEGAGDTSRYPGLRHWLARMESLAGFVALAGPAAGPAAAH